MKKIIVTGGLGFIGSNLIELLLKKNYYVINIDKITYSSNFYNTRDFNGNKNYQFIKSDINNKRLFNIFLKHKPSCIFNLAAETHVDRSIDNPGHFIGSNINGVYNILECFKKYYVKYNGQSDCFAGAAAGPLYPCWHGLGGFLTPSHPDGVPGAYGLWGLQFPDMIFLQYDGT